MAQLEKTISQPQQTPTIAVQLRLDTLHETRHLRGHPLSIQQLSSSLNRYVRFSIMSAPHHFHSVQSGAASAHAKPKLCYSNAALADARASAQTATVELRVYDHAGLSPLAVQSFSKQIQEIFSEAGVSVHIYFCARRDTCELDSTPARVLMLRIVPGSSRRMQNVLHSPLGQSFADHRGGTYASVFLEPVQQQAANNDVPWLTALAYAASHEIGHLLLGDQAHTPRGLMKAHWDKDDFRDMKQNRMHFTGDQVRELAECCASLSAKTMRREQH